jgi:hypothetical protein
MLHFAHAIQALGEMCVDEQSTVAGLVAVPNVGQGTRAVDAVVQSAAHGQ